MSKIEQKNNTISLSKLSKNDSTVDVLSEENFNSDYVNQEKTVEQNRASINFIRKEENKVKPKNNVQNMNNERNSDLDFLYFENQQKYLSNKEDNIEDINQSTEEQNISTIIKPSDKKIKLNQVNNKKPNLYLKLLIRFILFLGYILFFVSIIFIIFTYIINF